MAKARHIFVCKACGAVQTRWMGKCPDCNTWESLEQQTVERAKVDPRNAAASQWAAAAAQSAEADGGDGPDGDGAGAGGGIGAGVTAGLEALGSGRTPARPIAEVGTAGPPVRIMTGIGELDRVLGGGVVPGSAVLLGGDPGIGKSTLLLQAAGSLARGGVRTLYVSSEESAEQVKLRFARLVSRADGTRASTLPELFVLADTSLGRIAEQAAKVLGEVPTERRLLVIDSIQMVYKADLDAFPGSMTQLRRCCAELVYMAKATGTAVILVGHVTKDGMLAGPRLLEHLVDTVLYFEGDRYHAHRVVRAIKNRFGSTLELGLFEMTGSGLRESPDGTPVAGLEAGSKPRPGTVITPVLTGTRCLLVELQALTATGFPGAVKRKASGVDGSRLAMLIAVLVQHGGLRLADRDIFTSAVGGVKVAEPAADLGLLLAVAGAHLKKSLAPGMAAVGEVGLGGEVRAVASLAQRATEAKRLGCKGLVVPRISGRGGGAAQMGMPAGLEVVPVGTVQEAMALLG